MPVMDGITLLKNLRSMDSYKKTPIFMVSTENEKDIIIKSILNGATDYILKPYDINLVNKKLITVLAKK
jgi:two-component system chemotaxis response regulator CheY